MPDTVPSDHDAVDSYRVHLDRVGRTGRRQILLPEVCACAVDDIVTISLAGNTTYSQVSTTIEGDRTIRGAYSNRRCAREREGEELLQSWIESADLAIGDALVLDILREGFAYGLRVPGDRVVYNPPDRPNSSLADIANSLEDGE